MNFKLLLMDFVAHLTSYFVLSFSLLKMKEINFLLTSSTLTTGKYFDDIFEGADSIEDTIMLAQKVNKLCMAGGFPLQVITVQ